MSEAGYTKLFAFRGIPVHAHFSLALGLVLVGGLAPGAWLGYLMIMLVHQLGHAWVAQGCRLRVRSIELHALGGECSYEPEASAWHESLVAWGGVLGQLLLFAATLGLRVAAHDLSQPSDVLQPVLAGAFGGGGKHDFASSLSNVLLANNLIIAAFNLLPLGRLDGARAWRLPWLFYRRTRRSYQPTTQERPKQAPRKDKPAPRSRRLAGEGPDLWLVRDENGDFRFELGDEQKSQREKKP